MASNYSEILETRREVITDALSWSPSLTASLLKHNVLSEDVINRIEDETESKSRRMHLLLRELPRECTGARFYAFIAALEEMRCQEVAIILRTDAATGDKREVVSNMGRYIDLMDEELLQGLEAPSLDHRNRKALVAELRSRLQDIGRFIRLATQRKEQMRRGVTRLVDPSRGSLPPWQRPSVNLLDPEALDQWDAHEADVDKMLFNHVEEYIDSMEVNVRQLKGEVQRLQSSTTEKQLQWKTDEKGRKVYVEVETIPECGEQFVHVAKQDMQKMMKMLKPHRKLRYNDARGTKNKDDLLRDIEYLVEHVVDNLKERLAQTSDRITQLEKEKATVYEVLEEDDLERPLQDVVMASINHLAEERSNMETEVRSLRKNIEALAMEHHNSVQSMYDNSAREGSHSPVIARKLSANARNRRISAPLRPASAVSSPKSVRSTSSSSMTPEEPHKRPTTKQRRVSHVKRS